MISSPEPELHRGRRRRYGSRRRRLPSGLRRAVVLVAALGIVLGVSVFSWRALPERQDPAEARQQVAQALTLFGAGNLSGAREAAASAVRLDRNAALAHRVYGRMLLADGDGVAAEAEIQRARALGTPVDRTRHLLAHAWLLQGDADRALAEAGRAPARYAPYALRVEAEAQAMNGDALAANRLLARAIAAAPRDGAGYVALGRFRESVGDEVGAITASAQAAALAPGDPKALTLRAEMVRGQYGLVAALPWFQAALKRDPDHLPALLGYAATLGDAGRYGEMLAVSRKVQSLRPGDPTALYLQAVLAARAAHFELARALLQHAGGGLDGVPGAMLLDAALDLEAGVSEQAIGTLRNLIGEQPTNLPARRLLGQALLRSGDARGALDVLKPLALRPDADSYTLTLVGRAFEATGQRDWAARFLDRAAAPGVGPVVPFGADDSLAVLRGPAEARTTDPATVIPYVRALIDAGEAPTALAAATTLARANPGAPGASLLLGDALLVSGRAAEAVAVLRQAADARFDEPVAMRLIEAMDRAGDRAGAARTLALFLSQNPRNIAALQLTAQWQLAANDDAAAAQTLETLRARLGDRDPALLAGLAEAYSGLGDDDEALGYAQAAYRLAPLNPGVGAAYGNALAASGDADAARAVLEKAVTIAPRHAALRWQLAQVYAALGNAAAAKAQAKAALADPTFSERAAAAKLAA